MTTDRMNQLLRPYQAKSVPMMSYTRHGMVYRRTVTRRPQMLKAA